MRVPRLIGMILIMVSCFTVLACVKAPRDKKIEFVYLALGASDAAGVGALPLTEGYVYLIKRELDQRVPGVALINLGVPGARIDLIKEQVRIALQVGTKANLVTLWTGANDLVHGDDPKTFQENLRFILQNLRKTVSKTIVVANLPDLTQLPRFRSEPSPAVTIERVRAATPVRPRDVVIRYEPTDGSSLPSPAAGTPPSKRKTSSASRGPFTSAAFP